MKETYKNIGLATAFIICIFRKQSYGKTRADWKNARDVYAMMARTTRIYILTTKLNKLFSFFRRAVF